MKFTKTYTLEELPIIAAEILSHATTKTLLFYGEIGAGKTTLVKKLASILEVEDKITSPTFSIVNEYKTKDGKLYHFDFYRIESDDEALDIGVEEYFYSGHWNFLEWPERIENILPEDAEVIHITTNKDGSRTITMTQK